jgi:hypothetical protein
MHAVLRSTTEQVLERIAKTKGARPEEVASTLTYVVLHSPHLPTGQKQHHIHRCARAGGKS